MDITDTGNGPSGSTNSNVTVTAVIDRIQILKAEGHDDNTIATAIANELKEHGASDTEIQALLAASQVALSTSAPPEAGQGTESAAAPPIIDIGNGKGKAPETAHEGFNTPSASTASLDNTNTLAEILKQNQALIAALVAQKTEGQGIGKFGSETKHEIKHDSAYFKFPDPPLFNGERRDYMAWKKKTTDKLEAEYSKFQKQMFPEKAMQSYVYGRLDSKPAGIVLPWINLYPNATMDDFWKFMDQQFKDQQAAERAMSKLQNLRQRGEARTYVQEFNQLAMEANLVIPQLHGIGSMDVHLNTKRMLFDKGLRDDIRQQVLMEPRDTPFNAYVDRVLQADDELYRWNLQKKAYSSKNGYKGTRYVATGPAAAPPVALDQMDWEPTKVSAARVETKHETKQRAKWVTPAILNQRKERRLCVRCGGSGHYIANCQYLPARRPDQGAHIASAHVEVPPLLEGDDSDNESEKDLPLP